MRKQQSIIGVLRALCLAVAAATALAVHASSPKENTVKGFDFAYQIQDGTAFGIIQAFDDGQKTYFQFANELMKWPTVWIVNQEGQESLAKIEAKTPYLIVAGTGKRFIFKLGKESGTVEYLGQGLRSSPALAGPAANAKADLENSRNVKEVLQATPNPMVQKVKLAEVTAGNDLTTEERAPAPKASRADPSAKPQPSATASSWREAKALAVPFAGKTIGLSPAVKQQLSELLTDVASKQFVLRGRPSTDGDLKLATARTRAMKYFLMESLHVPEGNIVQDPQKDIRKGRGDRFLSEIIMADKISNQPRLVPSERTVSGSFSVVGKK